MKSLRPLLVTGLAAFVLSVTAVSASPLRVPLIPQRTPVWCWAASAEMILDALEAEGDHSQRRQAERLLGVAACEQVWCSEEPYTAAGCERTGFPQFYKYGYEADISRPLAWFAWPWLERHLDGNELRPIAFADENRDDDGQLTGTGHMVVLTSARDVRFEIPNFIFELGPLIAVNDPGSYWARPSRPNGEYCRASRKVWSYAHYLRRTPWVHYFGFRKVGETVPTDHAVAAVLALLDPSVEDPAKGESLMAARETYAAVRRDKSTDVVREIIQGFATISTEFTEDEDLAWLLEAAGLESAGNWRCDLEHPVAREWVSLAALAASDEGATFEELAFEPGIVRFLCTAGDGSRFSIEVEEADDGLWQLATLGDTVVADAIVEARKALDPASTGRELREVYVQGLNLVVLRSVREDGDPAPDSVSYLSPVGPRQSYGESVDGSRVLSDLREAARSFVPGGPS